MNINNTEFTTNPVCAALIPRSLLSPLWSSLSPSLSLSLSLPLSLSLSPSLSLSVSQETNMSHPPAVSPRLHSGLGVF